MDSGLFQGLSADSGCRVWMSGMGLFLSHVWVSCRAVLSFFAPLFQCCGECVFVLKK